MGTEAKVSCGTESRNPIMNGKVGERASRTSIPASAVIQELGAVEQNFIVFAFWKVKKREGLLDLTG